MPRRGIMVCCGKKSRGFPLPPQLRSTDSMETEARTPCPCPWARAHTPSSYSRQEGRGTRFPQLHYLAALPLPRLDGHPGEGAPLSHLPHPAGNTKKIPRTLSHHAGGMACRPPPAMPHSIVLYKQRILAKIQKTLPRKKGIL